MKFSFKLQQYQTDAVDSIVRVFSGQPYQELGNYRRDIGNAREVISHSQNSLPIRSFISRESILPDAALPS